MKVLTATLTVVLALSFGATALAQADGPTRISGVQSTTAPGLSDAAQGGFATTAAVEPVTTAGLSDAAQGGFGTTVVGSAADSLAVPSAPAGLSAFIIVLISLGAALTLAGVAYGGTRLVHQRTALS